MKITDKRAFEDAQIMARAAVYQCQERGWKEAFWHAAMLALKSAYKGK